MKIKTLRCLQTIDQQADCVVIQDDFGNPLFAAAHVGETIVCAGVGDNDFKDVLRLIGLPIPELVEIQTQQK
jgi:hypothetical protein